MEKFQNEFSSTDALAVEQQPSKASIPVGFVPTPTGEYRGYRKIKKNVEAAGAPVIPPFPIPPLPILTGSRILIYKQDPTVQEIGIRKVYLPFFITNGPQDARVRSMGTPLVAKNAFGDFIQTPGSVAFDTVQAFAVARMTLTMAQRALASAGLASILPWQWNSATNAEPLNVYSHGLPDTMNAFYSRNDKSVKFGDFVKPGSNPAQRIFTCRSLDIVAHETGHAILDALKPGWITFGNLPQTGGLHESFGDLTAIFLTLSQLDEVEAVIAQTKSNLHDKTFLSDLAEEFGLALGRPNGLRNADNDLKLSQTGTEVHAISQVFTGGIYDVLADIFSFEKKPSVKDDAKVLYDCAQYLYGLLLRAILAAPANNTTFADVVNQMLNISVTDGKPVQYRNFIRNEFHAREVVVSPTPLTEDFQEGVQLEPVAHIHDNGIQDRRTCCGTMKLEEYFGLFDTLTQEQNAIKQSFTSKI
jgi:hypothetical protein